MKLYFNNRHDKNIFLAEVETQQGALHIIDNFLMEHNYKSYYTRSWTDKDGRTWYDVGSHTEFFFTEN